MTLVVVLAPAAPASASASASASARAQRPSCPSHARTEAALRTLTGAFGLAGAAVAGDGPACGRWSAAAGLADLRSRRPMSTPGRIRIGSTTKTFTATVVLQLAAEGRISLDAPVERYLPGVIHGHGYDGRQITVRDLLQHTSGLPDHTDALDWDTLLEWRYRSFSPPELIALALQQPHPQQRWSYSSTNYVIAGLIVERVTGRDIGTEITRRLIRPLDLRDTYWPGDSPSLRGPHPHGYYPRTTAGDEGSQDPASKVDLTNLNMSFGGAAGALVSSLADENRFFQALLAGRLLPPRYLRQMMTTVEADPDRVWPGARYGLGLISTPLADCGVDLYWGHGGTVPGFQTLGGTTLSGRQVQLVVNDTVTTEAAAEALHATVRTALCETF